MDHLDAALVPNEFNQGDICPDNVLDILADEMERRSRLTNTAQGVVNESANGAHTEEETENTDNAVPPIEDLEAGAENTATTRGSEVAPEPPPIYSEMDPRASWCTRSCRNGPLRSCSKSCAAKVCLVWIAVAGISFSLAVSLKLLVFNSYSFNASPSDQRQLRTYAGTYFCQSVEIISTSKFNTFVLLFPPYIEDTDLVPFQDNVNLGIAPGNFQFWSLYLLEGSTIQLGICTDQSIEVLLFKTAENFRKYQDGCFTNSCPFAFSQIIAKNNCDTNCNSTNISIDISETNEYYVVLSAQASLKTVVAVVNLQLQRATYSVSSVGDSLCISQSSCVLTGTSGTFGILFVAPANSAYNSFVEVTCLADAETYLFLFLIIPIMIGCVASVSMAFRKRASRDQDDTSTQTPPRAGRRPRLVSGPPTYEELFFEAEVDSTTAHGNGTMPVPPPYQEQETTASLDRDVLNALPGRTDLEPGNMEGDDQNRSEGQGNA